MTQKNQKMAVLAFLQQEQGAFALKEILAKLGSSYAERSVRRWLNELVIEGRIKKTGYKRATRYEYKNVWVIFSPSFFEAYPMKAIDYVHRPIFQRKPVAYHKAWLQKYIPNKTFYLSAKDREDMYAHGQRGVDNNSAGTYARKIYNRLLIDLSYNSSRLEGNTYSLLETQKLIFEGRAPAGKLDAEKIMILNHKEAIRHLVDSAAKIAIDFNEVCTLHFLLSDGLVPIQYSGKVRDHGVRISASAYIPLEHPIELEQQLKNICQLAQQIKDPFECSFFLLTHIAYLQAFTDVNKRTSRLSANIPLIFHNQVPLSFNDVEKEDYNSAMIAVYELNDTKPLAKLYHFSYLRSCQQYNANVEAFGFDEVRVQYRQIRRDIIRHIVVNQLIGKALNEYLQTQVTRIPAAQRARFLTTVSEDLHAISPQRIAGLGITSKQLEIWLTLQKPQ